MLAVRAGNLKEPTIQMAKVLTFSTKFPSYHPKKGQVTNFVEKIWLWLVNEDGHSEPQYFDEYKDLVDIMTVLRQEYTKRHTVRGGSRFKAGDYFSPRIWSGKPYNSKQITIAPDIKIERVFDFKMEGYHIWINKELYCQYRLSDKIVKLAANDGLSLQEFWDWFPCKPGKIFEGQIICWAKGIEY